MDRAFHRFYESIDLSSSNLSIPQLISVIRGFVWTQNEHGTVGCSLPTPSEKIKQKMEELPTNGGISWSLFLVISFFQQLHSQSNIETKVQDVSDFMNDVVFVHLRTYGPTFQPVAKTFISELTTLMNAHETEYVRFTMHDSIQNLLNRALQEIGGGGGGAAGGAAEEESAAAAVLSAACALAAAPLAGGGGPSSGQQEGPALAPAAEGALVEALHMEIVGYLGARPSSDILQIMVGTQLIARVYGSSAGGEGARPARLRRLWGALLNVSLGAAGATSAEDMTLGICCVCFEHLLSELHIALDASLWVVIEGSLGSQNSISRKRGLHLLQMALNFIETQHVNPEYLAFFQGMFSMRQWITYTATLNTLETEYQIHLVEQVWPNVTSLFSSLSKQQPLAQSDDAHSTPFPPRLDFTWTKKLLERTFASDSLALRKIWAERLLKGEEIPLNLLPAEWVVGVFLELFDDTYWFGGTSDFSEHIAMFVASYCQTVNNEQKIQFINAFIQSFQQHRFKTYQLLTAVLDAFCKLSAGRPAGGGADNAGAAPPLPLPLSPAVGPGALRQLRAGLASRLPAINDHLRRRVLAGVAALLGLFTDYAGQTWSVATDLAPLLEKFPPAMLQQNLEQLLSWANCFSNLAEDADKKGTECYSQALSSILQQLFVASHTTPDFKDHHSFINSKALAAAIALAPEREIIDLLSPAINTLQRAHSNPYTPQHQIKVAVDLLYYHSQYGKAASVFTVAMTEDIVLFLTSTISQRLREAETFFDSEETQRERWEDSKKYSHLLGELSQMQGQPPIYYAEFTSHLCSVLNGACLLALCNSSKSVPAQLGKLLALDTIGKTCCILQEENQIKMLSEAVLHTICARTRGNAPSMMGWGSFAALFSRLKWQCLSGLFCHPMGSFLDSKENPKDCVASTIENIEEALMDSVKDSLADILRCLAKFLPQYIMTMGSENDDEKKKCDQCRELHRVLEVAWSAVKDIRRKSFSILIALVDLIFQPVLLEVPHFNVEDAPLKDFFRRIMEEGMNCKPVQLRYLVMRCCVVWANNPKSAVPYIDQIAEVLLYKEPILNPNDILNIDSSEKSKISFDFQGNMKELTPDHLVEQLISSKGAPPLSFVRIIMLLFIEDLKEKRVSTMGATIQSFAEQLMLKLFSLNQGNNFKKTGINNTKHYGRKLKSWQALCVLCQFLDEASPEFIAKINTYFWDVHEYLALPPIRQCMEVFGIHLVEKFTPFCLPFLIKELSHYNHRGQVLCSVLIIAGFILQKDADLGKTLLGADERRRLLRSILPWLGCAQGYARIIAQLIAYETIPEFHSGSEDEHYLNAVFSFLEENQEMVRMRERQRDFFQNMKPERLLCVKGLLAMGIDEHLEFNPGHLTDLLQQAMAEHFQQSYNDAKTQNAVQQSNRDATLLTDTEQQFDDQNIQRKILPWDQLDLAYGEEWRTNQANAVGNERSQFIVCASLIDKVPNLAGLARTCEIFAAEKLTIPNIKILEHDSFEQIAVTAHHWISIEEVKHENVLDYLLNCKSEGYCIIGLEQTANSSKLNEMDFPSKSVLLLGKEKEGIPVDLLQVVDKCVEIPQLGVIRSLNVHVSGAITLWEYTKQHRLT